MAKSAILLFGLLLAFRSIPVSAQDSAFAGSADLQEPSEQNTVIKDSAEYNAYMNAWTDPDPAHKAAFLEQFLKVYPQSVVRIEALESLMAAYQQIANQEKAEATADRILAISRDHLRALVVAASTKRYRAQALANRGEALALAQEARALAERGLKALVTAKRPQGVSRENWEKLRAQMAAIFNGAAGFGALQNKEFVEARDYYLKADLTNIENVFQLATAELEMKPEDVNGFWHVARAASLARAQKNEAGAREIERFGRAKYQQYHGGLDGWDELLRRSASAENPPHGFTVARYHPPAPQAQPQPAQVVMAHANPGSSDRNGDRDRNRALEFKADPKLILNSNSNTHSDPDSNATSNPSPKHSPCDPPAAALPRIEKATPGSVPASTSSFGSDSRPHGVPASISSPTDGHSHGVPASVTSIGTDCTLNGVPAGISSFADSKPHGVPASITSPVDGQFHGVPASVTSIGADGSLHGIPASILSPTAALPVLLVFFGDSYAQEVREAAVVPVFGVWTKKALPKSPFAKIASLKHPSPKRPLSKNPSGVRALVSR